MGNIRQYVQVLRSVINFILIILRDIVLMLQSVDGRSVLRRCRTETPVEMFLCLQRDSGRTQVSETKTEYTSRVMGYSSGVT